MGRYVVGIVTMAASMVLSFSGLSFSQVVESNTQDSNAAFNRDYILQRYAIGGKKSIFGYYYGLKLDCTPIGWHEARLSKSPENGEAKLVEGTTVVNYNAPNPRVKCNGKSTKAVYLQYIPNKGYMGNDSIEVEAINDAGQRNIYTYNITVIR
jgi:hypothetical protein